jgi:SAM-dependent methyltransferase
LWSLIARPYAHPGGADLFGESYQRHFRSGASPEERLLANLSAAGVAQRATIQADDIRKLPFEAASFDTIVNSYAIDHLNRAGVEQSLAEAARVLRPGGEFLLSVIAEDPWLEFTFSPLLLHNRTGGPEWWISRLQKVGFQVMEQGMRRVTLHLLAKRNAGGEK